MKFLPVVCSNVKDISLTRLCSSLSWIHSRNLWRTSLIWLLMAQRQSVILWTWLYQYFSVPAITVITRQNNSWIQNTVKHYVFAASQFCDFMILLILICFFQCYTSIFQAFDGQTEFNFVILSYSQNLKKYDARKKCVLQYVSYSLLTDICVICWDMYVFC